MTDEYSNMATGMAGPANHAFSITPHDDNDLAYVTRAIYSGGVGDVALITKGGETVTFKNVMIGTILPIRAKRVLSTGTTASMYLMGLY